MESRTVYFLEVLTMHNSYGEPFADEPEWIRLESMNEEDESNALEGVGSRENAIKQGHEIVSQWNEGMEFKAVISFRIIEAVQTEIHVENV